MTRVPGREASVRVMIVDSNRMLADLLADMLKRNGFQVTSNGSGVADALAAANHADVALVSKGSGNDSTACSIVRQLRAAAPRLRVLLVVEQPTGELAVEAFRAGVHGIFPANAPRALLKKCILAIYEGQIWIDNAGVHQLLSALNEPQRLRVTDVRGSELLSPREEDVVACVAEGFTNREIADKLDLSENTVKNYLFRIFDKLGISSRVELILYVIGNVGERGPGSESHERGVDTLLSSCRTAAQRGGSPEYLLGTIYRQGEGVPADKVAACMWFAIAEAVSKETLKNSRTALDELESELTPEQLTEAKRHAYGWLQHRAQASPPGRQSPEHNHKQSDRLALLRR